MLDVWNKPWRGYAYHANWQIHKSPHFSSPSEPVIKHLPAHHWPQLMLAVEMYGMPIVFQVFSHMPSHLIIATWKVKHRRQMWVWSSCGICHSFESPHSLLLPPSYHTDGRLAHLVKELVQASQPVRGISRPWTKAGWNEGPCALCHIPLPSQGGPQQGAELLSTGTLLEEWESQVLLEAVLPCPRTRWAGPPPGPSQGPLPLGMLPGVPLQCLGIPRNGSIIQAGAQTGTSIGPSWCFSLWGCSPTFQPSSPTPHPCREWTTCPKKLQNHAHVVAPDLTARPHSKRTADPVTQSACQGGHRGRGLVHTGPPGECRNAGWGELCSDTGWVPG